MADFPPNLRAEHLPIDPGRQQDGLTGLLVLSEVIGQIYDYIELEFAKSPSGQDPRP